ncbi:MAG TPA: hypothetical protein PKD53_23605, partial [Chloroflexaceae bacterium]|nr:hypothetical protein [Chloroflexaceae bacterium]
MHDPVRGFLAEVLRSFDRRFPAYVEEHDLLADILNDPDNTTAIVLKEFGRALVGLTLRELRALPGLGLHMLTATGRLLVRWLSLVLVGLALIVTVMVTIPLAQLLRGGRICLEVPLPWIARAPGPLLSAPALAGPHRIYLPGAAVARLAPLPRESAGTRPAAPWPTGAAVAPTGTAARPTATPTLARRWDAPAQPTATALALGLAPTAAPSVTPVATELPASATPTPWPTPGMPAAAPPDLPAAPSPTFAPSPTLAPISAPSPAAPPERLPTPTATSTPTPTATSTPTATPTTTATSTPTTTATSTP